MRLRGRPKRLTQDQRQTLAARHELYLTYRREAKRHSVSTLAKDFGLDETTVRRYLELPV